MTFGAIIDGGVWLPVKDGDPRALGMYRRHYSRKRYRNGRRSQMFVGPGEKMVLLTPQADAVFVWKLERFRKDGQTGINCSIFRNEGSRLSSDLIREADKIAWNRWPDEARHFTYIGDAHIKSVNPGYCFKKADWQSSGRNKDGRLTLLDIEQSHADD